MSKVFRYTKRNGKDKKFRPSYKHDNDLMNKVRDYIKTTSKDIVRKEELAEFFKVKPHEIEQCFQRLNLEGLLSQARKIEPHDYSRKAGDSCWAADIYYIQKPEKRKDISGRIILVNIDQAYKLNDNIIKLFIARQPLPNLDKMKWKWASKLAPSNDLLYAFKKENIDWETYYVRYKREVIYNPTVVDALNTIYNHLKLGEDIALICYCTDDRYCHRGILGEYYKDLGIEVITLKDLTNTYSLMDFFGMEIFNDGTKNKLLQNALRNLYIFNYSLKEYKREKGKSIEFSNNQLKMIVEEICKKQDIKCANFISDNYILNKDLQDKLDSVIVLGELLE